MGLLIKLRHWWESVWGPTYLERSVLYVAGIPGHCPSTDSLLVVADRADLKEAHIHIALQLSQEELEQLRDQVKARLRTITQQENLHANQMR